MGVGWVGEVAVGGGGGGGVILGRNPALKPANWALQAFSRKMPTHAAWGTSSTNRAHRPLRQRHVINPARQGAASP